MQEERSTPPLKDHLILCGLGSIGRRLGRELIDVGKRFVAVDCDRDVVEEARSMGFTCLLGEAENEETLLQAGIEEANGLILALPDDSDNVFVTLTARELNRGIFILARANYSYNQRKLLRAGADNVVAPEDIGADRMAQVILQPVVDEFIEKVLGMRGLGVAIEEVRVEEGAPLAGKTLVGSQFRQHFETVVLAVWDEKRGELKYNPSPDTTLQAGDVLIVIGSGAMIDRLRRKGCTTERESQTDRV